MVFGSVGGQDWMTDRQFPVFNQVGPRNNETTGGDPGKCDERMQLFPNKYVSVSCKTKVVFTCILYCAPTLYTNSGRKFECSHVSFTVYHYKFYYCYSALYQNDMAYTSIHYVLMYIIELFYGNLVSFKCL